MRELTNIEVEAVQAARSRKLEFAGPTLRNKS
jgi:hypothetical protein